MIICDFSSVCNFDDQDNHFQQNLMWRHVLEVSIKLMLTSKNKYILCLFLSTHFIDFDCATNVQL